MDDSRHRIMGMLAVKPSSRGGLLVECPSTKLPPAWRNNCLNGRIAGVFLLYVWVLKMRRMSSKCLLPLYNFINYPSEIPGACVHNGEDADVKLPPIQHPPLTLKPTSATRITGSSRLLLCANLSNLDDTGVTWGAVIGRPNCYVAGL
jgi:hypothetical protein